MRNIIFFTFITLSLITFSCSSGEDTKFSEPLGSEIGKEVECVVDGMKFTITKDTKVYEKDGRRYYFCGMEGELKKFKEDPDGYIMRYEEKHKDEHKDHQINSNSQIYDGTNKSRRIIYYRGCSMYPDYVSDSPGKCPAGMDLIPVYEDEIRNIIVDDKISSALGFKIVNVEETNINVYIRLPGRVVADSELYNLQSEYISTVKVISDESILIPVKKKLYLLGYDEKDLQELERLGKPEEYLVIPSEYFAVIAFANGEIRRFIDKGMKVYISLSDGRVVRGTVRFVGRIVDPNTLSIPVRIKVYDPSSTLSQNMYVNTSILVELRGLVVDKRAVIYTGQRKTIYVYVGNNTYVARNVEGEYLGDFFIVRKGISRGEKIVVNGNSLLDAQAELIGIFKFVGE